MSLVGVAIPTPRSAQHKSDTISTASFDSYPTQLGISAGPTNRHELALWRRGKLLDPTQLTQRLFALSLGVIGQPHWFPSPHFGKAGESSNVLIEPRWD